MAHRDGPIGTRAGGLAADRATAGERAGQDQARRVDVTRSAVLLTVAVGLGAAVVLAAGNVLPDVARYLRIRRM
jgi:hypothetical protein